VCGAAGPWGSTVDEDNAEAITGWNTTVAPDGAWTDGSKTADDPCPAGFRVPTLTQLTALTDNTLNPRTSVGTWTGSTVDYGSGLRFGQSLFLPAAGYRNYINGTLVDRGNNGYYWSSTEFASSDAWYLYFFSGFASTRNYLRTTGFLVRCIAE
jgi:uncharacterized protein (TIGR02145 family)